MDNHSSLSPDSEAGKTNDSRRLLRAFNISLAFVFLLILVFTAQSSFNASMFAVAPHSLKGLPGILTAPLLHGSVKHLAANAVSLLILGTLAGSMYPRATLRALPLLWLGSGAGAWLLGASGSYHLGASGVTHGLMFLVFVLGLLRRDRASIAAAMIAFLFYGGMLLTVLPREPGISWQSHMGGAIAGVVSAFLFRYKDPLPVRPRYSWEDEDETEAAQIEDELELPKPLDVPILWQPTVPPAAQPQPGGNVIPFPRRDVSGTGIDHIEPPPS
ncbi:MAG: rhomboid family intramembrane serine protease [Xanthomonadaceae bacterium]|jgi:membrane associated rhomboid family serine protease|nr:rhomboid family intramembrane serine protease [Xanthomonadaceae bacterium]